MDSPTRRVDRKLHSVYVSDQILEILPRLLRFACACTPNIETADECLELALRELVDELDLNNPPQADDLEKSFFKLVEQRIKENVADAPQTKEWRALILIHVEQMTRSEVAKILGTSHGWVASVISKYETVRVSDTDMVELAKVGCGLMTLLRERYA